VLGVCFLAFGYSPPIGVLVLGYLIGQLGGNIPVPGGIGGLELGLIGAFALYHQLLAATTAAVLLYQAIALWVPGLLGSVAFVSVGDRGAHADENSGRDTSLRAISRSSSHSQSAHDAAAPASHVARPLPLCRRRGCDRSTTASGAEGTGAEVSDRAGRPAETSGAS
jgi:hypothetical protein